MISSQLAAKAKPDTAIVHKWHVFQHIKEARQVLGATDRALTILHALLSFHPETALEPDGELIVWPSNEQLMARANGMPPTTLRRHLAVLVDCGLIIRRDSPNGKRFARKGQGGEIEQAYGFDLAPMVARAEEYKTLASAVQVEKKAFRVAKERLTILRRDIVKMIEAGLEEGVPGNWKRFQQAYQEIAWRIPRTASRQLLESLGARWKRSGARSASCWKHLRKHRIRTPMSPILVATYRIQIHIFHLNLNRAWPGKVKRAAAPWLITTCGACRSVSFPWELFWMPAPTCAG
ncbi:replication initiation protein RepC (plasmid) [Bradyrhizobium diazoefficiens]|uniref:Replication initiation protein RepC n=1 Tax=Bradyrhizobium diazoefficiens TaxID=1355477 RepID=A0A0E4FZ84_9BRAD|nr:replication initiation protein RepC [Bradyrhizobium diazoefficiens]